MQGIDHLVLEGIGPMSVKIFASDPVVAEPVVAEPATADFFETKIRPVLVNHCYECHQGSETEGGLRLDSLPAMQQGGESGPAVVPGDVENSFLIQAIRYTTSFYQMPPDGRLDPDVVQDFQHWIASGAAVPESFRQTSATDNEGNSTAKPKPAVDWDVAEKFWAFQVPAKTRLPTVQNIDWCVKPIDYFIRHRLEQANLEPAPPADRRTWLRRVTYGLTGLPPRLAEIDRFMQDKSPTAQEQVVDRLLASPAYGERWGRHWLDVARYADSNGLDENLAYSNAFRYRDYVIRAWNQDKPFDRFVQEQLAGDLLVAKATAGDTPTSGSQLASDELSSSSADALTATAFLSLGPKMLACDDGHKMELDIIDEQVDTTARAFMGLTMGCARCHDHKFDPILAADYYSMAGIFKSTKTMENFNVVAVWHEHELLGEQQREQKRAWQTRRQLIDEQLQRDATARDEQKNKQAELAAQVKIAPETTPTNDAGPEPDVESSSPNLLSDETRKALEAERNLLDEKLAALPRTMGVREGKPEDLAIHIRGNYLTLGETAPRRFPKILSYPGAPEVSADASGRQQLAEWLTSSQHPLTARVIVNRVWLWHFGEGLVRSPDNFGQLGQLPTHPELLDHLAIGLMQHGWSLKWLHRQLLLSATYGMSSEYNDRTADIDPENKLWARMARRRLSAEEVRDSLLEVGGDLDRTMGGQLMPNKNRDYVTGTGSTEGTYDFRRRSVYLPILRSAVYNVFQAFDFGDPSVLQGQRATTTVTPQALFMMNSNLVAGQADAIARALLQSTDDEPLRISQAYQMVLRRDATPAEQQRANQFVTQYQSHWQQLASAVDAHDITADTDGADARDEAGLSTPASPTTLAEQAAWRGLCRVLMASSEFLYLD